MEGYEGSPLSPPFRVNCFPWELYVGHTAKVTYKNHLTTLSGKKWTTGSKVVVKTTHPKSENIKI